MCYVCDKLMQHGLSIEEVRAKREFEDLSKQMLYCALTCVYFGTLPFLTLTVAKRQLLQHVENKDRVSSIVGEQWANEFISMQQQDWLNMAVTIRLAWIALMCHYVKYYPSFLVVDAVIDKIVNDEYSGITH